MARGAALAAPVRRRDALAGRLADGVLLNWTTPDSAGASIETVAAAAANACRAPVPVGGYVRIAAGPDAAAQARAHTAFYAELPAYRRSLVRMGLGGSGHVATEAARELVLQGPAESIARRVQEWRDAGVDPLVVYPVGDPGSIPAAVRLAVDVIHILTPSATTAGSAAPVSDEIEGGPELRARS
nr:LLM class flavin-dependent oxidoreductase [Pseudonocardia nigra]